MKWKWMTSMILLIMALSMTAAQAETAGVSDGASVADVLLKGAEAVLLPDGTQRTMDELLPDEEGAAWSRFTRVDLDADGEMDVVAEMVVGEYPVWYLLLKQQGDRTAMQLVPYRGLMHLKDDGSFEYSNSAMDGGAARYEWTDEGFVLVPADEDQSAVHQEALDALWYEYSQEWLERILLEQTG